MLWYKAWLETRARFLIALVGCMALCIELVLISPRTSEPNEVLLLLHGVHQALVFLWILAIALLMMGGLVRENAIGSASFTLSLPVSRWRLMWVRLVMGLTQGIVVAILSWTGMLMAAHVAGKAIYLSQAGFHIFLLFSGGVVFLAFSFLISSLIEGEYTAPIVSFGVIIMLVHLFSSKSLVPYGPWAFMTGELYFHHRAPMLVGPLPWLRAGAFLGVAALLTLASTKVIDQRDF